VRKLLTFGGLLYLSFARLIFHIFAALWKAFKPSKYFVLGTESYLYELFITFFCFIVITPQLYTQFDVDMLFHFVDSDGTIKREAQNMFIQNNNA